MTYVQSHCNHPGCDREHKASGWCEMHYARWKRGADMDAPPRARREAAAAPHVRRRDARLEDIDWMLETREHPENVCKRIGMTPSAVAGLLRRNGREAEAVQFHMLAKGQRRQRQAAA